MRGYAGSIPHTRRTLKMLINCFFASVRYNPISTMRTLRLFIAASIPTGLQKTLASQTMRLPFGTARLRPVPAHNMHITLKFLGDSDQAMIPAIIECLEQVAEQHEIVDLELTQSVLLPPRQPRTIGMGIGVAPQLQQLYEDLDSLLAERGLAQPERRRFTPHITTARIDGVLGDAEREAIAQWSCKGMPLSVTDLVLFESTLTPQGPVYTALTSAYLL